MERHNCVYETHGRAFMRNFKMGRLSSAFPRKEELKKGLHDSFSKRKGGTNRKPPSPPLRPFSTLLKWHHKTMVTSHQHCQITPLPLSHATWHSCRECLESSMSLCQIDSLKESHIHTHCWLGSPTTYILPAHGYPSAQCGGVGTTFCISTVSIGSTAVTDTRVHCHFASLLSNPVHRVILTWRLLEALQSFGSTSTQFFLSIMVLFGLIKWSWLADWYS